MQKNVHTVSTHLPNQLHTFPMHLQIGVNMYFENHSHAALIQLHAASKHLQKSLQYGSKILTYQISQHLLIHLQMTSHIGLQVFSNQLLIVVHTFSTHLHHKCSARVSAVSARGVRGKLRGCSAAIEN